MRQTLEIIKSSSEIMKNKMETRKTFYVKIYILLQLFDIHRSHIQRMTKVFDIYIYIHIYIYTYIYSGKSKVTLQRNLQYLHSERHIFILAEIAENINLVTLRPCDNFRLHNTTANNNPAV